jgi:hypothetical protein
MKKSILLVFVILQFYGCNDKKESKIIDNKIKDNNTLDSTQSQYAIESNTMIFYDNSIADAIKARKFYKCSDVFNDNVYAKVYDNNTSFKKIRVVSFIYNESQLLEIDLRQNNNVAVVECYILGYIISNGSGGSILEVINPRNEWKVELFIDDIKSDFGTISNKLNDNRTTGADPIVNKNDNNRTLPFRRINVFNSEVYLKSFEENIQYKVVDIYRPAELYRSFTNPPTGSQSSWFVTAIPVDNNRKISSGNLKYFKNPRIIED